MKKKFEVKGLREKRVQEISEMILTLMIISLIMGIFLILIIRNDIFTLTLAGLLISTYSLLLYKFRFVQLGQFIVDHEYSVYNFYEVEDIQIHKKMNETKILKNMDVFQEIGLDSPDLISVRDMEKTTLQLVWNRMPNDEVPAWNGLAVIFKYALKMGTNNMK